MAAEKKIELQDIENDNLKSEKQKDYDSSDPPLTNLGSSQVADYLKSGVFRYFEKPVQPPQPTRFVQQYAVTEAPERPPLPPIQPKLEFTHVQPQQAMVGYLSNVPMQIYLVPQYYNEGEQGASTHATVQYTTGPQYTLQTAPQGARVTGYNTAPETVQTQNNYIEVPAYTPPTAKTYVPQYTSAPVAYLSYTPPSPTSAPTVEPVVTYQVPILQYQPSGIAHQQSPKDYYQNTHYQDNNAVEEEHQTVEERPKSYHSDGSYTKAPSSDYPRYYSARPPSRDEYRSHHNHIQELPHPNPLLLKPLPSHLSHIPKALPMYKPNNPVYGSHPPIQPSGIYVGRPNEHFGTFKRRPTSLLDSYVPSRLQIEYMKRGYTNDPLQAYEALSSGHHFSHAPAPRHFERGFLPNQMYHTAAGGVTFGHYKRTPKVGKA